MLYANTKLLELRSLNNEISREIDNGGKISQFRSQNSADQGRLEEWFRLNSPNKQGRIFGVHFWDDFENRLELSKHVKSDWISPGLDRGHLRIFDFDSQTCYSKPRAAPQA